MIPSTAPCPVAPQHTCGWTPGDDAAFRWLVRRYESVSRDRAKTGEQIRAIVEGRDAAWGPEAALAEPVERVLADIRHGRRTQPDPVAARYRELCDTERAIREQLAERLTAHPAWPWLSRVHGVGTTLAAQLLARLDRSRARRPSSFWAFCGLATMPAYRARCVTCGAVIEVAASARPARDHADARDGSRRCRGHVEREDTMDAEASGLRVATTRGGPDVLRTFDQAARVTCHMIGVSMLRTGGAYEAVYHEARERFSRERAGWSSGRIHLSALRVMEKRFLLDLWHAWLPPRSAEAERVRRGSEDDGIPARLPVESRLASAVSPGRPSAVA